MVVESDLVEIWSEVLGRRNLNINDDFFEIGGTSELAVNMIARSFDKFNREFDIQLFIDKPTIENIVYLFNNKSYSREHIDNIVANKVSKEPISIESYNDKWVEEFNSERRFLFKIDEKELIKRIEHFGSTSVPGLCAKPIVDILVEVKDTEQARIYFTKLLSNYHYECIWRMSADDVGQYYPLFIKRNNNGQRIRHIHMIKPTSNTWNRLYFRDYLIDFENVAIEYQKLKQKLISQYPEDRYKYSEGKTEFVRRITSVAKSYFEDRKV